MSNPRALRLNIRDKEDIARAGIAFLQCPYLINRELTVFNTSEPLKPRPGFVMPENIFSASYSDQEMPTSEELNKCLKENMYLLACMAAVDLKDEERVGLNVFPYEQNENPELVLMVYSSNITEKTVLEIIDYIENSILGVDNKM